MNAKILGIDGKEKGKLDFPKFFSAKVREDIVAKVLEAKKKEQPYAPSPVAGKQHSASGILIHRRKVWKSQYGRGISRVPRKVMSNKGSQFNWVGAEVPNTRGGRRAHPPKVLSRLGSLNINKKELKIALESSLSATAKGEYISKKYESLANKKIENVPFIVDSKLTELKAKELKKAVFEILGKELFEVIEKKKKVRAGKGKTRGRKYKSNAGLLIVIGKDENLKTRSFEVEKASTLGVNELARGGVGRLTLYTENAIKELGEKLK